MGTKPSPLNLMLYTCKACQPLHDDLGQEWKDSRPISTLLGDCSPQTQKCLFSHYFRISRGRKELLVAGFQRLSILPCIWLLPCDKPIVLMRLQVCPFLKVAGRLVLWCWPKEKDKENSKGMAGARRPSGDFPAATTLDPPTLVCADPPKGAIRTLWSTF